jgi:hypothetical protein
MLRVMVIAEGGRYAECNRNRSHPRGCGAYFFDITSLNRDGSALRTAVGAAAPPPAPGLLLPNSVSTYLEALSTGGTAVVPELETFNFADLSEDTTIRDRLIEQNLDEALRYLQNCVILRKEYGDIAKLHLDTSLKMQEFFRLDDIHQMEVAAGLYEIPYHEADFNRKATEDALKEAKEQHRIFGDLYGTTPTTANVFGTNITLPAPDWRGALTPHGLASGYGVIEAANSSTIIASKPFYHNSQHPDVHHEVSAHARLLAEYRSRLEGATWHFNVQTTRGNLAELEGRLQVAGLKRDYAWKDITFRAKRAGVSRQLAYVQLEEHTRTNSVLNYSDRLANIAKLFDLSARQLVIRVLALRRAANALYQITTPFQVPTTGTMVDRIAEWLLVLQDQISRVRRRQKTSIFTVLLSGKIASFANTLRTNPFNVSLTLNSNDTWQTPGLLRGFALEYLGGVIKPLQFKVSPPASATGRLSGSNDPSVSLFVGRVLPISNSADIRPQHVDATWNGDPYGTWQIACSDNLAQMGVEDVALHLWLAHS